MDEFTKAYQERTSQASNGMANLRHMLRTVHQKREDAARGGSRALLQSIASAGVGVSALSFGFYKKPPHPAARAAGVVAGVASSFGVLVFSSMRSHWDSYDVELRELRRHIEDTWGEWYNLKNMICGANDPAHIEYLTGWRMSARIENLLKKQATFEQSINELQPPRFSVVMASKCGFDH